MKRQRYSAAELPIYAMAMSAAMPPLPLLLKMFSGWVNRRQVDVIEYSREESRLLD